MPESTPLFALRRARRRRSLLSLTWLAALLSGCNGAKVEVRPPPVDARTALREVNAGLASLHEPVSLSPAIVSFRYRDSNGADRRFIGHPATILFDPPRCMLFRIKSLAGTIAQIGSNDERFWVWVDTPEQRKLWWGDWDAFAPNRRINMPVPPDELQDALMLRPLPDRLPAGLPPLLETSGGRTRLLYQRVGGGWPYIAREVVLDNRAPYMPVEVIDRNSAGEVLMRVELGRYRSVSGADGLYFPGRYVIRWKDGTELRLDVENVKLQPDAEDFCEFPARWDGEVETVTGDPGVAANVGQATGRGQP